MSEVPSWFTPGKVHRFAREALAVCLHDDSIDPTGTKKAAKKGPKKRVSPLAGEQDTIGQRVPDDSSWSDENKREESAPKSSGCLPMVLGLFSLVLALL